MNICVFNWLDRANPLAGGAELHLHETFSRLAAAGHAVTVISSGWGGGEPTKTVLDGMTVIRTGRRLSYPLGVRSAYARARRTGPFDVVVEDLNKVPLFTPMWIDRPLVLLVHHLFGETAFSEAALPIAAATWLLERPIGRVYRGIPAISVSESTRADLAVRGLNPDDIEVIHNGVDLERFSPAGQRSETPTLLYLGRLKRYKRIEVILEALARLKARGHEVVFEIAGTGDHRKALEARVRALDLTQSVRFLGYVSEEEKVAAFRRSWVHVLMSEKEGWGLTNVEAAACGTATVAANAPGLRDSVKDGETGVLVDGEDPERLAKALQTFVASKETTEAFGRRAAAFARTLTWDRSAEAVLRRLARASEGDAGGVPRVRR